MDDSVPWPDRERCVRAIVCLFKSLFAVRCAPQLSHLIPPEPGLGLINTVCYMWWERFPLVMGEPQHPDQDLLDETLFDVMRQTLEIPHDACRESALHGLGHWCLHNPQQVETVIDAFLVRNRDLRPELQRYAIKARAGYVN